MNLKEPMFVLNKGMMELTDLGAEYISEVNNIVSREDSKMKDYEELLKKYLLD